LNINDLDLRAAVMYKMQGSSENDIRDTIQDAIVTKQEKTLPGLGVLFELVWNQSNPQEQSRMIELIHNKLQ
jgi:small acid-soluble spore protein I (minor)